MTAPDRMSGNVWKVFVNTAICPDFRSFQYLSRAKIPIHHGARIDRKGRIDRKQAYKLQST